MENLTKMQIITAIVNNPIDVVVIGADEYRIFEAIKWVANSEAETLNTMQSKSGFNQSTNVFHIW